MFDLGLCFYFLSLIFQLIAIIVAFYAFKVTGRYKSGWLIFSAALLLMTGRRISPILTALETLNINFTDAALSLPISVLLALSVIQLKRAFKDLSNKTQRLESSQRLDTLTNAISRAELIKLASIEIERSIRTGRPMSVLMMDIDYFKHINDTYGHQAGDHALQALTSICQGSLRKIDIFARYGGEEFVAILPETNKVQAWEAAERLRTKVESHLSPASGLANETITVSIGIAEFTDQTNALHNTDALLNMLIKNADVAMYQAKNTGRNQVVTFS